MLIERSLPGPEDIMAFTADIEEQAIEAVRSYREALLPLPGAQCPFVELRIPIVRVSCQYSIFELPSGYDCKRWRSNSVD